MNSILVGARSLESLMEGQNWFLNQFDENLRRSIIVCFLSLSAKAGLNLSPFEIRAGIFSNRVGIGLSYLPARLVEFTPWNRFLGYINV